MQNKDICKMIILSNIFQLFQWRRCFMAILFKTVRVIQMLATTIARAFSSLALPAFAHTPRPFTGNYQEIVEKRKKHFTGIYNLYYKDPLLITEGHMQYLWDHQGNRYLDLESNGGQVSVGHTHPSIRKIIQDQSGRLIHTSTIYMSEAQGELSKLILDQLGPAYESIYLCNTTGQAIDFSLMIGRVYTQQKDIYSFRNAYHGLVGNARSVTSLGNWSSTYIEKLNSYKLPWPAHNADPDKAFSEVKDIIKGTSGNHPGMLVYEPLQTKAGVLAAPHGYTKKVIDHFQSLGGLTICDQSTTGLGRSGKSYWGHRWQECTPDVVVVGAGLGNGNALCAVATNLKLASVVKHNWFNTFAAGHMQTKIGCQVIRTIKRQKLHENSENIGKYLLENLQKLVPKFDSLSEVNGLGLVLGLNLVKDGAPSKENAIKLLELARERNLLMGIGGVDHSTLLIRPPLCLSMQDAVYIVQALEDALTHLK